MIIWETRKLFCFYAQLYRTFKHVIALINFNAFELINVFCTKNKTIKYIPRKILSSNAQMSQNEYRVFEIVA